MRATAALALLAGIAGALYGAYHHGVTVTDLRWEAKQADEANLESKAFVADTTAKRTEEQRRQNAVNEVANDSRKQEATAAPGVAAAGAAADGLRSDTAKLVAAGGGLPGDPSVAARSEANRRAALVLSGLLDRSVARNRELAQGVDDARRRGFTCERAYRALTH
jgi:hypothetical protein